MLLAAFWGKHKAGPTAARSRLSRPAPAVRAKQNRRNDWTKVAEKKGPQRGASDAPLVSSGGSSSGGGSEDASASPWSSWLVWEEGVF